MATDLSLWVPRLLVVSRLAKCPDLHPDGLAHWGNLNMPSAAKVHNAQR